MEKITLIWANKFRELISENLSETEIIKRYREYIVKTEKDFNERWNRIENGN